MNALCEKLLLVSLTLISFEACADIFVCKDNFAKIIYQDEPCQTTTLRTLKNVPDAPIEDQILARERIEKANALSLQRAQLAATERQEQDKANREYQAIAVEKRKLELLEKQNLESEQVIVPQWIVGGRTGFGVNRFNPYRYGTGRFGHGSYGYNYPGGYNHSSGYVKSYRDVQKGSSQRSGGGRQSPNRK